MTSLLTPKQVAVLTAIYQVYRLKKRVERKTIEWLFYQTTGKKLGSLYYSIPVVKNLIDLA